MSSLSRTHQPTFWLGQRLTIIVAPRTQPFYWENLLPGIGVREALSLCLSKHINTATLIEIPCAASMSSSSGKRGIRSWHTSPLLAMVPVGPSCLIPADTKAQRRQPTTHASQGFRLGLASMDWLDIRSSIASGQDPASLPARVLVVRLPWGRFLLYPPSSSMLPLTRQSFQRPGQTPAAWSPLLDEYDKRAVVWCGSRIQTKHALTHTLLHTHGTQGLDGLKSL